MPEDAVFVEGNPAIGREVAGEAGTFGDGVVEGQHARNSPQDARDVARESVPKALDDLEERQIDVGRGGADQAPSASGAVSGQHLLEIAEELRDALADEERGGSARFPPLVL